MADGGTGVPGLPAVDPSYLRSDFVSVLDKLELPIPVAFIVTDIQGTVTHWTRHAETMYGWSAEEVIGRSIMDLTVGPETEEEATAIMAALADGRPWEGEFRARRRDGSPIDVHVIDLPTRDRGGEIDGVFGASFDVSLQRQAFERRIDRSQVVIAALENAREMERRRIAGELHDEIGQQLSALRTKILGIGEMHDDPAEVERLAASAVERLDDALAEVRRICAELRPIALEVAGLGPAVQALADHLRSRTRLDVDVDVDGYCGGLGDGVELQLYRITQECLTNVERHARAGRVTVTLLTDVDGDRPTIVLEVSDDGVGIPDESARSGSGLHIIDERADRIGADLSISHLPDGTGTRVRVVVPHEAHDRAAGRGVGAD